MDPGHGQNPPRADTQSAPQPTASCHPGDEVSTSVPTALQQRFAHKQDGQAGHRAKQAIKAQRSATKPPGPEQRENTSLPGTPGERKQPQRQNLEQQTAPPGAQGSISQDPNQYADAAAAVAAWGDDADESGDRRQDPTEPPLIPHDHAPPMQPLYTVAAVSALQPAGSAPLYDDSVAMEDAGAGEGAGGAAETVPERPGMQQPDPPAGDAQAEAAQPAPLHQQQPTPTSPSEYDVGMDVADEDLLAYAEEAFAGEGEEMATEPTDPAQRRPPVPPPTAPPPPARCLSGVPWALWRRW